MMAQQEGREVSAFIREYLDACKTVARTAKRLGVSVTVLYREMRIHRIPAPDAPRVCFSYRGREDSIAGHIKYHNLGIDQKTVRSRITVLGWGVAEALETPVATMSEVRALSLDKRQTSVSERAVEGYLKDCVEGLGGEIRKVAWVGRRGAPDRLVMLRGRCVWVELKKPTIDKPDSHQAREHERMRLAGGCDVRVINTFAGVDALIDELVGVGNARSGSL